MRTPITAWPCCCAFRATKSARRATGPAPCGPARQPEPSMPNHYPSVKLQVLATDGKLFLPVPWQDAERLQSFLRDHDIGTTLHVDPTNQAARLEVWPGADAAKVEAALAA